MFYKQFDSPKEKNLQGKHFWSHWICAGAKLRPVSEYATCESIFMEQFRPDFFKSNT
jgi:hypothetical protein